MTATTSPAYSLAAGEDKWSASVGGIRVQLLARQQDTAGRLLVFRYEAPPGWVGPPLHRHDDLDEAIYVLDGTLRVRLGDDDHRVAAGGFAWMPRTIPHAFTNAGDELATFVGLVSPPGNMQGFFEAVAGELAGSDGPPDPQRLMQLNADHGIDVLGPPIGASGGA